MCRGACDITVLPPTTVSKSRDTACFLAPSEKYLRAFFRVLLRACAALGYVRPYDKNI